MQKEVLTFHVGVLLKYSVMVQDECGSQSVWWPLPVIFKDALNDISMVCLFLSHRYEEGGGVPTATTHR